jgi:hypothetical protein
VQKYFYDSDPAGGGLAEPHFSAHVCTTPDVGDREGKELKITCGVRRQ